MQLVFLAGSDRIFVIDGHAILQFARDSFTKRLYVRPTSSWVGTFIFSFSAYYSREDKNGQFSFREPSVRLTRILSYLVCLQFSAIP